MGLPDLGDSAVIVDHRVTALNELCDEWPWLQSILPFVKAACESPEPNPNANSVLMGPTLSIAAHYYERQSGRVISRNRQLCLSENSGRSLLVGLRFSEVFAANGITIPIDAILVRSMFLPAAHPQTRLVTASTTLEVDCAA